MIEYFDAEGKKLRRGFYFYLPRNIYDDEISTSGNIYYFTGKFENKGNPIFKTFNSSEEMTKVLTKEHCWYLKQMNPGKVKNKIKNLEKN